MLLDLITFPSKLKSRNPVLPRAYGLVKIHKSGNPLRMIISSVKSATYDLSRFFSDIFQNVVGKKDSHVQHSLDFKEKIKGVRLPRNHRIFSLDVTALFTNISKKAVLDTIKKRWRKISEHTSLTLEAVLEGVELIYDNCYFTYNGRKYRQKFGSPMGSPISPSLAELVLEQLEAEVLERLQNMGIRIDFYYRYVDDIIMAANARDINRILEVFNNFDPEKRLRFTIENEVDESIAFLDIKIHRNRDGRLECDWYHKSTWSGRYLNFESYLPVSYKRNTVKILCRKILDLADVQFREKNFTLLEQTLLKNGYPPNFIQENMIREITPQTYGPVSEPPKFISLPFDNVIFGRVRSLLQPYNVRVVGKAQCPLDNILFSNLKDRVDKKWRSDLVYEVTCECQATYVGKTHQHVQKRFEQHLKGDEEHSSLSAHLRETGHKVTFDDLKILCTDPSPKVLSVKEAIHIKKKSTRLNTQWESRRVSDAYNMVLGLNGPPPLNVSF